MGILFTLTLKEVQHSSFFHSLSLFKIFFSIFSFFIEQMMVVLNKINHNTCLDNSNINIVSVYCLNCF